jgi:transposase
MSRLGYSVDFRECVLAYLSRGHSIKSASDIFKITEATIHNWRNRVKKTGHCNPKISKRRASRKIDDVRLLEYTQQHPDALLSEIAQHFSCSSPSVWQRLKILKITRKKNYALRRAS